MTDVVLGYCHPGTVRAEFHDSIVSLILHRKGIGGRIALESGPRIAAARNQVVRTFLEGTGDFLLMLDVDMAFPPDTLDRLLLTECELREQTDTPAVVGALCFRNHDGVVSPVMYREDEDGLFPVTRFPADALVEVAATGAACILIPREIAADVEKNFTCCFEETRKDGAEFGEDATFCLRVRELGYKVVVDTGIAIGHVKTQVLDLAAYEASRRIQKQKRRKRPH